MIWPSIIQRDVPEIRFAINVFIGATITWYVLTHIFDANSIWAIASMIAASDPQVVEAARMFKCRITNVFWLAVRWAFWFWLSADRASGSCRLPWP